MPDAEPSFAGLLRARRAVVVLWLAALAVAAAAAAGSFVGAGDRALPIAGVRALGLSTLAFAPSGTAARDPAAVHPAVDLRFVPNAPELR